MIPVCASTSLDNSNIKYVETYVNHTIYILINHIFSFRFFFGFGSLAWIKIPQIFNSSSHGVGELQSFTSRAGCHFIWSIQTSTLAWKEYQWKDLGESYKHWLTCWSIQTYTYKYEYIIYTLFISRGMCKQDTQACKRHLKWHMPGDIGVQENPTSEPYTVRLGSRSSKLGTVIYFWWE